MFRVVLPSLLQYRVHTLVTSTSNEYLASCGTVRINHARQLWYWVRQPVQCRDNTLVTRVSNKCLVSSGDNETCQCKAVLVAGYVSLCVGHLAIIFKDDN